MIEVLFAMLAALGLGFALSAGLRWLARPDDEDSS